MTKQGLYSPWEKREPYKEVTYSALGIEPKAYRVPGTVQQIN